MPKWILVLLALACAGCAGMQDNQDFNSWKEVEIERQKAWAAVMLHLARNPRTHKITMKPIDPSKPANAEVHAEIAVPDGPATWDLPAISDRPKSMGEIVLAIFQEAPTKVVKGLLGWRGIEAGEKVLLEGYRRAGTQVGGNYVTGGNNTQVGGNQITGGTYVGRDGNWNSHNTTNTTTTTNPASPAASGE